MKPIEYKLFVDTTYVRPGCGPNPKNPDDYCTARYSLGTHDRGYTKLGRLQVTGLRRPNLVLDKPQHEYQPNIEVLVAQRDRLADAGRPQIARVAAASACVAGGSVAVATWGLAPAGVGLIAKGVAIGATAGLVGHMVYAAKMGDITYEYNLAICGLGALNDMITLMHTQNYAAWMLDPQLASWRRNINPVAFDQGTLELQSLNLALPWTRALPTPTVPEPELNVPRSTVTLADVLRERHKNDIVREMRS